MSSYLLRQSWTGAAQILPQVSPPSRSIKLLSFLNSSWSSLFARTEQFWGGSIQEPCTEEQYSAPGVADDLWGSAPLALLHLAFFVPLTGLDDLKKYLVLQFCLCPYRTQPDKPTLVVRAAGPSLHCIINFNVYQFSPSTTQSHFLLKKTESL